MFQDFQHGGQKSLRSFTFFNCYSGKGRCYLRRHYHSVRRSLIYVFVLPTNALTVMIAAAYHRKLVPLLIMLVAMSGMTFSAIGEASSHGIAELTGSAVVDHQDHSHSHDPHEHGADEKSDPHMHHDSGNHTHDTADRLTIHHPCHHELSLRQSIPFAGDSPHSFRYRLDRPPKASLIV